MSTLDKRSVAPWASSASNSRIDRGGGHYHQHGIMMPDNGLDDQRDKDTILSGSAGDPYTPDHVTP